LLFALPKGLAQLDDRRGYRVVADDAARPYVIFQLFTRYHLLRTFSKIDKHIHYFGLELDVGTAMAQLIVGRVHQPPRDTELGVAEFRRAGHYLRQ